MKVIHLISGGDSGGAKTHVLSLLQNLNKTITAQLVCFRDGPFADEARKLGIPTRICGGNNVLRVRRELSRYIRQEGFELIHCHGSRANMIGAMLRKSTGLPVVTTVHSDYRLDYMGRPLSRLTFGTINAYALRKLDYRIGVSDAMVDLLISRGFPADRFYAIYNGIDFTPAPPPKMERLEYLRQLGVDADENSVVVGIAARLNPVKDMSTLIRGFAAGYASCPRLRLVIAGDGEEREKLGALARELGVEKQVTFAGWISGGMDQFYATLDINALTSLSETFPYALTEGARFHLATVATAVGGIPHLIDSDVNGFLFAPGDFEALGTYLAALGNDDALRHDMGEKLYEKASTHFSIQNTVDTQLHIYQEILRRHRRPARARDGVVICGAYGRGNAGDDAILEAILQEMRSIDPDMPITVLSKDPKSTRLTYRVQAVHRSSILAWHKAMRHARLYINGGGSLIQDVTSRRSLWFYLYNIRAAKRAGCQVQMYGCGIGPVTRESHRALAAKVLNAYVDVITLREPDSREELLRMGVTVPRILLTADPALTLRPASDAEVDSVLLRAGIPPHGKYLCFALRQWKGFDEKASVFAQAARYAYETYGLTPVFTAVEKHLDPVAHRQAAANLDIPRYFLDDAGGAGTIIGALARMDAVVSMRLHALIFAASQGVPLVGVVYDPKVSSFLKYMGQELFVDLDSVTSENLCAMIDRAVCQTGTPQSREEAVARLQEMEQRNVTVARELLDL
ncbi:polysaccharide pyruvyl transferase CsaB [uncultured Oscillibacter sp.]|uniref:polysaccharide pyruvyl transferase CsaB n=1 Tax=uncultured Oscillibacter sp. TaxID=876091 RepID=UPI00280BF64A|nr:polysaccharide pyruvyl transferase CsaB [uncultured Oscillibacter sp.]